MNEAVYCLSQPDDESTVRLSHGHRNDISDDKAKIFLVLFIWGYCTLCRQVYNIPD